MILGRIQNLSAMLQKAVSGYHHRMSFCRRTLSQSTAETKFSFEILGDRTFYDPLRPPMEIFLSGYFDGFLDIKVETVREEEPLWKYICPDVRVMVWQALQTISETDVQKWFAYTEEIVVRHSKVEMKPVSFRYDKIDSCMLLYFYHREKTVANFLEDVPFAKDFPLFRTLLCHAVVGNLELSDRVIQPPLASMSGLNSPASDRIAIPSPPNTQKVSGLRKILSAIKNM